MEREKSTISQNYLTNFCVTEVLQVENHFLQEIIKRGLVRPPHVPRQNGKNLWGPKEIFRAFLCMRLSEEYETKYGDKHDRYKYHQIRSEIISAGRSRRQEFLESDQWAEVTVRAAERGLNLLNL